MIPSSGSTLHVPLDGLRLRRVSAWKRSALPTLSFPLTCPFGLTTCTLLGCTRELVLPKSSPTSASLSAPASVLRPLPGAPFSGPGRLSSTEAPGPCLQVPAAVERAQRPPQTHCTRHTTGKSLAATVYPQCLFHTCSGYVIIDSKIKIN